MATISESKWESIRLAYITSEISFRALSKKSGVSANAISNRAKRDDWESKRIAYRKTVQEEAEKKALDNAVEKESEYLSRLIQCSNKLDETLERFLTGKVRIKEARDVHFVARALKDALEIKKGLHGIEDGNNGTEISVRIVGATDAEAKEYAE